ncbi:GtrA family protein [Pseudomonas sp. NBRC 111124]|uniref:GtrA family protein n=1 Tax=Pseudomonas sp. NBRC 111124 TaxID=1661039 RepID=UPI000761ACBF|nr:GtrA family protein [Pseudomonas sp. NBRC 111124]
MTWHHFARYGLIGIGNTLVHWLVFLGLHLTLGFKQAPSNLLAFTVAATVSYQLNARYTFASRPTGKRYLLFLLGMGCLSLATGGLSDLAGLSPLLTLVTFSAISLVAGYCFSHTVVFRRKAP